MKVIAKSEVTDQQTVTVSVRDTATEKKEYKVDYGVIYTTFSKADAMEKFMQAVEIQSQLSCD